MFPHLSITSIYFHSGVLMKSVKRIKHYNYPFYSSLKFQLSGMVLTVKRNHQVSSSFIHELENIKVEKGHYQNKIGRGHTLG